jgi:hypothetical protein
MKLEERLQKKAAKTLKRAIEQAASYLEREDFSFEDFSNVLKVENSSDEPPSGFPSIESLLPLVENFEFLDDNLIWYELNQSGLAEIDLEFKNIGGGNLTASLSRFGRIEERYLVTITAEPKSSRKVKAKDYEAFDIHFQSIDDDDGSHSYATGSLNVRSGLMSIAEQSIGVGVVRDDISALTSVNDWILSAKPM